MAGSSFGAAGPGSAGQCAGRRIEHRTSGTPSTRHAADIGAEFLFQVIAERAERATLIVTTNLPFSEWTQVFPNPRLCKALLDRITDRAHIIETGTESYRFRRTLEVRQKKKAS